MDLSFFLSPRMLASDGQAVGATFLWGLASSLHCLGMCGGFALSEKARETARTQGRWKASFLYHAGRLLAYGVAGVLCGWIGQGLSLSPTLQVAVPLVGGLFLLFWGLQGSGLVPALRRVHLPHIIALERFTLGGNWGPFPIGLFSVLLPCAPLQIALIYAASQANPARGGLAMVLFWAGTVPLLLLVQAVANLLSGKALQWTTRLSSLVVLFMGIGLVSRGLVLAGVILPSATAPSGTTIQAQSSGAVQRLHTEVHLGEIPKVSVRQGIPVVWSIHADKSQLDGCTSTLTSREFGFRVRLHPGTTTLSFVPNKKGTFAYSSWCGMLHSTILVTD